MPAVATPIRNSATVSFISRPKRFCKAMNAMVPNGRATKARAKMLNAYNSPSRRDTKGKNTEGNTSTDAIPYTKKSKYSDARPMTTPMAISPGSMRPCWSAVWLVMLMGDLRMSFAPWNDIRAEKDFAYLGQNVQSPACSGATTLARLAG